MNSLIIKIILVWIAVMPSFYTPTMLFNPDIQANLVGVKLEQKTAANPQGIIDNLEMVPRGTKVLNYFIIDDIAYIDLSHEFIDTPKKGSTNSILTVYSIVDTFCSAEGIKRVQIMIEGKIPDILFDGIDGSTPLSPSDI